jgi:chitinase
MTDFVRRRLVRGCAIGGPPVPRLDKRQTLVPSTSFLNITTSIFDIRNQTAEIEILRFDGSTDRDGATADAVSISAATAALANMLKSAKNGATTTLFAKSGNAIVGLYAGSQIDSGSVGAVIREFAIRAGSPELSSVAAQLCQQDFLGTQIFGLFLDTGGNLGAARAAVRDWRDAKCMTDKGESEVWQKAPLATIPGKDLVVGPDTTDNARLDRRATCSKY